MVSTWLNNSLSLGSPLLHNENDTKALHKKKNSYQRPRANLHSDMHTKVSSTVAVIAVLFHLSSVISVDTPCRCHINAECYGSDEGKKICVCKLGFVGDGKRCKGFTFINLAFGNCCYLS